jgi:hypothetical protein
VGFAPSRFRLATLFTGECECFDFDLTRYIYRRYVTTRQPGEFYSQVRRLPLLVANTEMKRCYSRMFLHMNRVPGLRQRATHDQTFLGYTFWRPTPTRSLCNNEAGDDATLWYTLLPIHPCYTYCRNPQLV